MLQYHEIIDLPAMAAMPEPYLDAETVRWTTTVRLCGGGIFGNPNDVLRILVVGMVLAAYWVGQREAMVQRPIWLAALLLLVVTP